MSTTIHPDDGSESIDWTDLTAFQRDILHVIADLERDGTDRGPVYGLAVKRELETYYGEEVNHGRLYPNLDELVAHGLVEKDQLDKRTNSYTLTEAAESLLEHVAAELAEAVGCRLDQSTLGGG